MHKSGTAARLIALLLLALVPGVAAAQQEIPPPSGKGRVVVVLSGATGAGNYRAISGRIAALGYDVVLFDSSPLIRTEGRAVRAAIDQAMQMPHALPGKIGLVGFSQGGQLVLGYGTAWSGQVAVVAAWYPETSAIKDVPGWASRIKVPVVMFAGEEDTYKVCCLIAKARALAGAAKAAHASFELTTYPGTQHGFNLPGSAYNPSAEADAFTRTEAALKQYLGN